MRCESLDITTMVASPKRDVIAKLSVGDILEVTLRQSGQGSFVHLVFQGEDLGGVASPDLTRLRECMEGGTDYTAGVISIDGANVRVRISVAAA